MQVLSESMNVLLQVGPEGINITDPAALPKVWHGLSVLQKQAPHIKVIPSQRNFETITRPAPAITSLTKSGAPSFSSPRPHLCNKMTVCYKRSQPLHAGRGHES